MGIGMTAGTGIAMNVGISSLGSSNRSSETAVCPYCNQSIWIDQKNFDKCHGCGFIKAKSLKRISPTLGTQKDYLAQLRGFNMLPESQRLSQLQCVAQRSQFEQNVQLRSMQSAALQNQLNLQSQESAQSQHGPGLSSLLGSGLGFKGWEGVFEE